MMHWTDTFIGRKYVVGEFDCAHLLLAVHKEVFGKTLNLPVERNETVFGLSRQVADHVPNLADRIDLSEAQDGDLVIMTSGGRLNHCGIYVNLHSPMVLHNLRSTGNVCLHKIRDLPRINLQLEGVYRWREYDEQK